VTAAVCVLLMAASCLAGPYRLPAPSPDDDPASVLLLLSENDGASSRPLFYPMPGAPECPPR
jgi:hypothetical protein